MLAQLCFPNAWALRNFLLRGALVCVSQGCCSFPGVPWVLSPCWCGALLGGTAPLTPLLWFAVGSTHACCCLLPRGHSCFPLTPELKTSLNPLESSPLWKPLQELPQGPATTVLTAPFAQTLVSYAAVPPGVSFVSSARPSVPRLEYSFHSVLGVENPSSPGAHEPMSPVSFPSRRLDGNR